MKKVKEISKEGAKMTAWESQTHKWEWGTILDIPNGCTNALLKNKKWQVCKWQVARPHNPCSTPAGPSGPKKGAEEIPPEKSKKGGCRSLLLKNKKWPVNKIPPEKTKKYKTSKPWLNPCWTRTAGRALHPPKKTPPYLPGPHTAVWLVSPAEVRELFGNAFFQTVKCPKGVKELMYWEIFG